MKGMFDIVHAFFRVISKATKGHPSSKEIFLPLEQMMRATLFESLDEPNNNNLLASWESHLPKNIEKFPTTQTIPSPLPSQLKVNHEPIKKKLKPGIDHDYLLLWFVSSLTKVYWSITEGFENVSLLPSNPNFQSLESAVGNRKSLGPLFHFSGFLSYLMKIKTKKD
jgi:hypothetical protein